MNKGLSTIHTIKPTITSTAINSETLYILFLTDLSLPLQVSFNERLYSVKFIEYIYKLFNFPWQKLTVGLSEYAEIF